MSPHLPKTAPAHRSVLECDCQAYDCRCRSRTESLFECDCDPFGCECDCDWVKIDQPDPSHGSMSRTMKNICQSSPTKAETKEQGKICRHSSGLCVAVRDSTKVLGDVLKRMSAVNLRS